VINTFARGIATVAVGTLAGLWSSQAEVPQPPPARPTTAMIERYISCYPKIDRVRGEYRAEVKRLEHVQLNGADLARLRAAAFPSDKSKGPDLSAYRIYQSRLAELVHTPAMTQVFLPVLQSCGYASVGQYAHEGHAVRWHAKTSDLARPHLPKLEGMLMQNLE
jgi:hypothetical protein